MLPALLVLTLQLAAPPADTIRVGYTFRRDRLEERVSTQHLFNVRDGERKPAGVMVRTLHRDGSRWLFIRESFSPQGSGESWDTLAVDGLTLAPRWHRSHAAHDSASVDYTGISVRGWSQQAGQALRRINVSLPSRPFPSGMLDDLLGLVSLRSGYTAHVELYDMWRDTTESVDIRVSGTDMVSRGGQPVTAWVVDRLADRFIRQSWIARADGVVLRTHDRLATMPPDDGSWMESPEGSAPPERLPSTSRSSRWPSRRSARATPPDRERR